MSRSRTKSIKLADSTLSFFKSYLIVPRRFSLLSACLALGFWAVAHPASAQLVPHLPQVDLNKLEQQGLGLLQEATQLAQFQQFPLALSRARLATQLAPKAPESWAILGSLYLQANDLDKGIESLKKAQSLDPRNAAISFALGSAYFQKADYSQSINYVQAGLKLKPNTPGALFDLGNAHMMLNNPNEAIDSYQKAIAQDKAFWPAINNIGLVKYEAGDANEAIKLWKQAVLLDAKAVEPKLAVAVALYAKGDRAQALALGESALKMDSRYSDIKFLKDNLWGARLLADTQTFFAVPKIQATIAQAQSERVTQPETPEQ
ncbi:tetratricopeptide repeat protein [Myxacorys almedinensis]|uniref:tetratricopeptide repeat protein n=1 Tax=Myxacorys almedinensis TaxID=2651157 RepID=UPI001EE4811E|nr:tetratricopeptide repeat protein [Myxacorys almedinensis]